MTHSLQFKLSIWLCVVIVLTALAGGVFSFVSAFHEANEIQDDQLRQIAALVNARNLPLLDIKAQEAASISDSDARVMIQTVHSTNHLAESSGRALALPANTDDGMHTIVIGNESWRLFVKTLESGVRFAIAQQTAVRDEIARDSALRTVMPFALLIPVLLLIVGLLIRQMFVPVKALASELHRRTDQDLGALSQAHLPLEIMPFVVAINQLLSRVQNSMALQRRFVADAAHELRSPLTALSLQAERLAAAEMSTQAKMRLGILKSGLQRTRALLDQLLTLARVQEVATAATVTVSIQKVMRQVLEDLLPLAERKAIDLGVAADSKADIAVSELDLQTLLRNLVDNAIRYTPGGGRIDLSVHTNAHQVILQIDDTGPGIPAAERHRVFDPFYRVLGNDEMGSGLGLSIVKAIADRIGASIQLFDAKNSSGSGLSVVVTFVKPPMRTDPASREGAIHG